MNGLKCGLLLGLFILAAGCATQEPVSLDASFWQHKETRIGVALQALPKPNQHSDKGKGLLDNALNLGASSSLSKHLEQLDLSEFTKLADNAANRFRQNGIPAKRLDKPLDPTQFKKFKPETRGRFAPLDYRPLKDSEFIGRLLILRLNAIGTFNEQKTFVATATPQAFCSGGGQLIDLSNNQILWQGDFDHKIDIQGAWKEPPAYSNLTQHINQAAQFTIADILNDVFKNAEYGNTPPILTAKPPVAAPKKPEPKPAPKPEPAKTAEKPAPVVEETPPVAVKPAGTKSKKPLELASPEVDISPLIKGRLDNLDALLKRKRITQEKYDQLKATILRAQ